MYNYILYLEAKQFELPTFFKIKPATFLMHVNWFLAFNLKSLGFGDA